MNRILRGLVLSAVLMFVFAVKAEARWCYPADVPSVEGSYLMSFRYLLPDEPAGIEFRGTRDAYVQQCGDRISVKIVQPDSTPEVVRFDARINHFGEVSVGAINFGYTGGSPQEVIVRDMSFALTARGNAYGSAYLNNPAMGRYNNSRILLIFEPED